MQRSYSMADAVINCGSYHAFGTIPEALKALRALVKDREDLAVARLAPDGQQWLTATLERLGYAKWAELVRQRNLRPH